MIVLFGRWRLTSNLALKMMLCLFQSRPKLKNNCQRVSFFDYSLIIRVHVNTLYGTLSWLVNFSEESLSRKNWTTIIYCFPMCASSGLAFNSEHLFSLENKLDIWLWIQCNETKHAFADQIKEISLRVWHVNKHKIRFSFRKKCFILFYFGVTLQKYKLSWSLNKLSY